MALKDLKSTLSNFRIPKKTPLADKPIDEINKGGNLTPLGGMLESTPKVSLANTTPNKNGADTAPITQGDKFKGETTPTPMNNLEKFLGETTPTKFDNSEKFLGETTTKPMSLEERYLGETTQTPSDSSEKFLGETTPTAFDNSSKFIGETTQTPSDNASKFLGETTPTPSNNAEKFLGETTPTPSDNSEKFLGETTTKPMSLEERYLGETTPTTFDNSSKFIGETTPTAFDNSEKFLGETTPTPSDNSSKFLGETTQTPSDNSSKFLGETTQTPSDNASKFLGETTPTPSDNSEKFLGETTQTSFDNASKFLGETTQIPSDNSEKFLGETTQIPSDNTSKFLGITTPNMFTFNPSHSDNAKDFKEVNFIKDIHAKGFTSNQTHKSDSKFVGINKPQSVFDGNSSIYGTLRSTGFSLNQVHMGPSEFVGNEKLSLYSTLKSTDYFPIENSKARGFTLNQGKVGVVGAEPKSMFLGVSGTAPKSYVWDSKSSKFSNHSKYMHDELQFNYGYDKFRSANEYRGKKQKFTSDDADASKYESSYKSIGKTMEERNSPSFIDKQYSKYNLRDDAHQTGMAVFKHPLILRGIQRRGKKGNEPQNFGIPGTSIDFDDGLIRGGIITSTTRAVIDAIRLGKWMVSIKGLLWGVKQFGLQQSNPNVEKHPLATIRRTKMWTPINTLASAIGAQIGLHPNRHGFTPFDSSIGSYESVQSAKRVAHINSPSKSVLWNKLLGNRLAKLHKESFGINRRVGMYSKTGKGIGMPLFSLAGMGGPNSVYGLIPNGKFPVRGDVTAPHRDYKKELEIANRAKPQIIGNSHKNKYEVAYAKKIGDEKKTFQLTAGFFETSLRTYSDTIPENSDDKLEWNLAASIGERPLIDEKTNFPNPPSDTPEVVTVTDSNPTDYKNLRGGNKPSGPVDVIQNYETVAYGDIPERANADFRTLLKNKESNDFKLGKSEDYPKNNIEKRLHYGSPGAVGDKENRYEWWNTSAGKSGNSIRHDEINAAELNSKKINDLVHIYFGSKETPEIQFRGLVSGITDTFSPSWDSHKYNGRADSAYQYKSFERSLSFNLKVYATSRIEMKPIWSKLGRLASHTMPNYVSNGYNGSLLNFTLGDLYSQELVFIDSLSYAMADDAPWDVSYLDSKNPIGELPMGVDVTIGLKILGKSEPTAYNKIYKY